jgi:hypothetical protein
MLRHSVFTLAAAAALSAGAPADATAAYEPVYITDGQFTATLEQHSHTWHLQPLRGDEVDIVDHARDCGSTRPIPHGLWYVSQDDHGRAQLVAPSVTPLPQGYPQHVTLKACGDKAGDGVVLFVPAVALTWINDYVGTVLIDD